jgi:transmembrane serine protease 3
MSDVFEAKGPMSKFVKYYVEISSNSLYVIPSSCKQEGEPAKPIPPSKEGNNFNGNASLVGTCGQTLFPNRVGKSSSSMPSTRIVGGTEARPHSMPWIASLQELDKPFCGGALMRCNKNDKSRLILTAAHCIKQPGRWTDLNPADLTVNLGEHSITNADKGEQKMKVEAFEIHSKYDEDTSANDIAVVQLKTPVTFSETIQPVCLPNSNSKMPDPGTKCIVAGWGTTSEGGRQSDKLMQVFSPILSDQDCTSTQFYGTEMQADKMFCAGYKEGQKDSCQGDSGGPYVCYDGNVALQYGVVSFGIGCAREAKPGVYTRLINYRNWIEEMKSKYCA